MPDPVSHCRATPARTPVLVREALPVFVDAVLVDIRRQRREWLRRLADACENPDAALDALLELDELERRWLDTLGSEPFR